MEDWELVLILLYAIACVILLKRYLKKENFTSPPPTGTTPVGTTPPPYTVTPSDKPGVTLTSSSFTKGSQSGGVDVNPLTGDIIWKSVEIKAGIPFGVLQTDFPVMKGPNPPQAYQVTGTFSTNSKVPVPLKIPGVYLDNTFNVVNTNLVIPANNESKKFLFNCQITDPSATMFYFGFRYERALAAGVKNFTVKVGNDIKITLIRGDPTPDSSYRVTPSEKTGVTLKSNSYTKGLQTGSLAPDNLTGDITWSSVSLVAPTFTPATGMFKKSDNGYQAVMQPNGNFVVLDVTKKELWSSNTVGKGKTAQIKDDGNFVIRDSTGKIVWASMAVNKGTAPYKAEMQNDGNFVIRDSTNKAVWSTNTAGKGTGPLDKSGGRLETDYWVVKGPNSTQAFQVTGTFSTDSKVPIQLRVPGIFVNDTFSRVDTQMFIPANNVPKKFLFNCYITEPVDKFYFGFVYTQPMAASIKNFKVKVGNDVKITLIKGDPTPVAPPLYPAVTSTSKTYTIKSAYRKSTGNPTMFLCSSG